MPVDQGESNNLAEKHPDLVQNMTTAIMKWNAGMPKGAGNPAF
ncbi:MAG: hypothetical protein AAGA58_06600 [Verrucomicrobiota bacterium]